MSCISLSGDYDDIDNVSKSAQSPRLIDQQLSIINHCNNSIDKIELIVLNQ